MNLPRVQVLAAADRRAVPWKNGGGITRQVAVSPDGASLDDFEWRISLAQVSGDGPFSAYPGIDRVLLVLRGSLSLQVGCQAARTLHAGTPPLSFRGEDEAFATVIDGPVVDLSVMTRRGQYCARIVPASTAASAADPGGADSCPPDWTVFLLDASSADVNLGAGRRSLQRDDAILAPGSATWSGQAGAFVGSAAFHRIDLWRRIA